MSDRTPFTFARLAALLLAACAAGLALSAPPIGGHGSALRLALAAPLLLGGVALPWLVLLAPREPSRLKLFLFGALLSTPMLALYLAAAEWTGREPRPVALLAVALSQLALLWRPPGREPLGRAAWSALGLGLAAAALVAGALVGGSGAPLLTRPEVLWHAGVADEVLRRGFQAPFEAFARASALEHPWLAGTPLPASPVVGTLAAVLVTIAGVAAPHALAGLTVLAALVGPIALYLTAAAVWREPRRDLASVLLGLFGWNALGGLWPRTAAGPLDWARELAAGAPFSAPGAVHYGGSAFLCPGAVPLALAFSAGALAAGVHAVRHGLRPWPLLAAALTGLAALTHAPIGVATGGALVLAAIVAGGTPRARVTTALAVALALLPAAASVGAFGADADPVTPTVAAGRLARPWLGEWLAPASLLLAAALAGGAVALVRRARGPRAGDPGAGDPARGAALALLGALPLAALALGLALPADIRMSAALGALAAPALGVLAAGGLGVLLAAPRRPVAAALGLGLGAALLLGGGRAMAHAAAAHARYAAAPCPVQVQGLRTVPRPGDPLAEQHGRAYAWIAERSELAARGAVLVRHTPTGAPRVGGPTAPHLAALATGLPLWWDAPVGLNARAGRGALGDGWEVRGALLAPLYSDRHHWDVNIRHLFQRLGRPLVFVVDELDRRATTERGGGPRGVDSRLLQLGAREVFSTGDVAVLVLEPEAPQ